MRRLDVYDFDDTLVHSGAVVARLAAEHPAVPGWAWWHDPKWSTLAARSSTPIRSRWRKLAASPATVVILTGRVSAAVLAWCELFADDPDVGRGMENVTRVLSTDDPPWAGPERVPAKKARVLREIAAGFGEVHVYDDVPANLAAMSAAVPRMVPHLVGPTPNPRRAWVT